MTKPIYAQTSDDQALQIARQVVDSLNKSDFDLVYALFDSSVTKVFTEDQLKAGWASLTKAEGTYISETNTAVSTVQGYKVVILTLEFTSGTLTAIVSINDQGKMVGLNFRPTPTFTMAPDEQEVTFKNGDDTIYGTLLIPANAKGKIPAVLLISGSGPTDRDGNSALLLGKIDSHKQFARILADAGIASLRFDKYGTGKSRLGSYATQINNLTLGLFTNTVMAAYQYLSGRAEVDPSRMAILGHSEGGLFALLAATKLAATPQSPVALMLMAPLSKPYMVTIRDQIAVKYANAVATGALTQKEADAGLAELDQIIAQVIKDGTVPDKISAPFVSLFAPSSLKYLQGVSQYDPAKIAAALPKSLKVLLLCGEKDEQVPCADVQLLADGFKQGGNSSAHFNMLANVDHVFKEISGTPNMATDYTDPTKPFSAEATKLVTDFAKSALLR